MWTRDQSGSYASTVNGCDLTAYKTKDGRWYWSCSRDRSTSEGSQRTLWAAREVAENAARARGSA